MKKTKSLTTLILVCLIAFGVFSLILSTGGEDKKEYDSAVALAEDYMKRELYQLAIAEYDKAIAIKDSVEIRTAELEAYSKRYEESVKIIDDYISAAESAVTAFPKSEQFYIVLADVYNKKGNFQAAYKALGKAKENGIESDKLNQLHSEYKYAFEIDWSTYDDFKGYSEGLYPVNKSGKWGFVDETGSSTGIGYSFVSTIGDNGIRILISEQNLLIDENDVVRGKLNFIPTDARAYSEGFIAINNGNSFGYYNSLGDYKFGEYLDASNFQDGEAAVCVKENEWVLIDTSGKNASNVKYEDIVVNPDGSYRVDGIMIAKKDGKYRLYSDNNKAIGNFSCDNVDILTESGVFAFESGGKWGFANNSGEIVIKAQYESAKSFSRDLATVCKDGKWGFITNNGDLVIDYQFFDADYFNSNNYCFVKTTEKNWQMIRLIVKFQ